MKKNILYLSIMLIAYQPIFAQISSQTFDNGSITITPKGVQSKFSGNTNTNNSAIGLGDGALYGNKFATNVIAIGAYAHFTLSGGTSDYQINNIAIGNSALYSAKPTSIVDGFAANARQNIAIGNNAMYFNATGSFNTAVGAEALYRNNADFNTAVGYSAVHNNTTGTNNSGVGYFSLFGNIVGYGNSGHGAYTLFQNKSGSANTAVGSHAMYSQNFANGDIAFPSYNVAVGYEALRSNNPTTTSNGIRNTAIGANSLTLNAIGFSNTAVGASALFANTYSAKNVAIGDNALALQSFANGNMVFDAHNVAVGFEALYLNLPTSNSNGVRNTAIGSVSMRKNTIGHSNVAIGYNSLNENTEGNFNTVVGISAGQYNKTGIQNVAIGDYALFINQTGRNNIAIGNEAGFNEEGSDKLYIENSGSNIPLIGGNFVTDVVGINMPITSLAMNTTWKLQVGGDINATGSVRAAGVVLSSDRRFKKNIRPIKSALDVVQKINGYTYDWRASEFPLKNFTSKPQMGVIAQEIEKIFPELVDTDAEGYKSVNYVQLTPLMIEAIKELKKENEALKGKNQSLESRLDRIEAMLNTENKTQGAK